MSLLNKYNMIKEVDVSNNKKISNKKSNNMKENREDK
jgi:hypothetical protein